MQVQYSPPLISKLSYPPPTHDDTGDHHVLRRRTRNRKFIFSWFFVYHVPFWHMVAWKRNVPCLLAKFTIPGVFPPFDFVFTLPKVEEQYWTFLSSQSSFRYRCITLWLHDRNVKSKSVSTVITAGHIFLSKKCATWINYFYTIAFTRHLIHFVFLLLLCISLSRSESLLLLSFLHLFLCRVMY